MRGECVRQAKLRGELSAEKTGAENPERNAEAGARCSLNRLIFTRGFEVGLKFENFFWKAIGAVKVPAKSANGSLVCAGRAAEAEIDPARIE